MEVRINGRFMENSHAKGLMKSSLISSFIKYLLDIYRVCGTMVMKVADTGVLQKRHRFLAYFHGSISLWETMPYHLV